jgi:hypothetical protein
MAPPGLVRSLCARTFRAAARRQPTVPWNWAQQNKSAIRSNKSDPARKTAPNARRRLSAQRSRAGWKKLKKNSGEGCLEGDFRAGGSISRGRPSIALLCSRLSVTSISCQGVKGNTNFFIFPGDDLPADNYALAISLISPRVSVPSREANLTAATFVPSRRFFYFSLDKPRSLGAA